MAHNLTEGAIQTIMTGGDVLHPVLQILGHKKIGGSSASSSDRYRLLISDGVHLNSFAMLATQLNDKVTNGELQEYSIVRINRHVVSMVNNQGKGEKRVMIILDVTVLQRGAEVNLKIGNPVPYTEDSSTQPANINSALTITIPQRITTPAMNNSAGGGFGGRQQNNRVLQSSANNSPMNTDNFHPIAFLSPYQNKWVIKARVTTKSPVRQWSNARGEGKLFSVDLVDESGEIRMTAFRDQVDKFYDMIEVNKVYCITRCQLKQANKKFSNLKNDYEMTCTSETRIDPCNDDTGAIPTMKYNFTSLSSLQEAQQDTIVDVIGVCKTVGDISTVVQRTTNKELKKRDVVLVDNSLSSVNVTLWNAEAENFSCESLEPIVAIKQARVSDFGGGKSLNISISSMIQVNPDIPEAHKLRGWYDALTHDAKFNSLSARGGGSEGGMGGKCITLKESKSANVGSDKADYFNSNAHIMHIRTENYCYKACPLPDCNKKVLDQNTGMYRCEKCNKEYDSFKYRLILSLQLADMTDAQWVSSFQDTAEQLLGSTAEEIGNLIGDDGAIEELFQAPLFKCYNLRLRSKMETYNDETRRKVHIMSVKPVDNREYANYLLKELREMSGVSLKNGN